MSIAITPMLVLMGEASQKFHKTQNLSSLYRKEKEKEKLKLIKTLIGQPSPFPFGISFTKKHEHDFCTPGANFSWSENKNWGNHRMSIASNGQIAKFPNWPCCIIPKL